MLGCGVELEHDGTDKVGGIELTAESLLDIGQGLVVAAPGKGD